jgi:hypothetical protein
MIVTSKQLCNTDHRSSSVCIAAQERVTAALQISFREIFGSSLVQDTIYMTEFLHGFPQRSQTHVRIVPRLKFKNTLPTILNWSSSSRQTLPNLMFRVVGCCKVTHGKSNENTRNSAAKFYCVSVS